MANLNQLRQQIILVASGNVALKTTGTLRSTNGKVINLANGQLGMISAEYGQTTAYESFIPAGDATVTKNRFIQLVQGTPNSVNTQNFKGDYSKHQPVIKSHIIDGKEDIMYTMQAEAIGFNSLWYCEPSIYGLTDYNFHLAWTGEKSTKFYNGTNVESITLGYTTPDYTAIGGAITSPVSHATNYLVHNLNKNSKAYTGVYGFMRPYRKFVAFAMSTSIGNNVAKLYDMSGVVTTGDALYSIILASPANTYQIPVEIVNGETILVTIDAKLKATIAKDYALNSVDRGFMTVDIANADSAEDVGGILFYGLDWDSAKLADESLSNQAVLHVGLEKTTLVLSQAVELVNPERDLGTARMWKLISDRRYQLNQFTSQSLPVYESFVEVPSYIDLSKTYRAYIIISGKEEHVIYSHVNQFPKETIILVDESDSTTTASITSVIKAWLLTCTNVAANSAW